MSIKEKLEEKIQKTERKLNEFSISLKRLDREYQQLLQELALTPEQVQERVENPDPDSAPIWDQLKEEEKKWDERLNLELNSVSDPLKTKKAFSERASVQQHWLFVR